MLHCVMRFFPLCIPADIKGLRPSSLHYLYRLFGIRTTKSPVAALSCPAPSPISQRACGMAPLLAHASFRRQTKRCTQAIFIARCKLQKQAGAGIEISLATATGAPDSGAAVQPAEALRLARNKRAGQQHTPTVPLSRTSPLRRPASSDIRYDPPINPTLTTHQPRRPTAAAQHG